jgi:hypothetical protein
METDPPPTSANGDNPPPPPPETKEPVAPRSNADFRALLLGNKK